jgi:DNA replication and repair protein RecF
MHLHRLQLINFKNYAEVEITFADRINVLTGKNGSGKTNLLDAIYYLSLTKSAFSASDNHCIKMGEPFFMVKGFFETEKKTATEVVASFQTGSKKNFRDGGLEYQKLGDHIGKYPVVLISPDDTDLIKEGGDARRKFFDGIISQFDRNYLESLIQYNYTLKQRNGLLRMFYESGTFDALALEAYDVLLIRYGEVIFKKRLEFLNEFVPIFQNYYGIIVENELVDLTYESGLKNISYPKGLEESLHKDQILQRTNFGIHKDDYTFRLGPGDLKRLGSQGQQKSFVIALKLAQHRILENHKGFKPILLLDDIFDKLDDFRISQLIELIHEELGQIFLTDARPDRTKNLLKGIGVSASRFDVDQGHLRPHEEEG